MANLFECLKCGGKGKICGFEHIANGDCFQCCGTGRLMTREQRAKVAADKAQKNVDSHDRRLAKECGLSLEEFRHISDPKRYPRMEAV